MLFFLGLNFVHRFSYMGEAFPDLMGETHEKPTKESFYDRPVLRAGGTDYKKHVVYEISRKNHKQLFEDLKIKTRKVLHQGRAQGQTDFDRQGVALDQIARMAKYIHSEQFRSYMLESYPTEALLAGGGYEHTLPKSATAAHLQPTVPKELLDRLEPKLHEQLALVQAALDACGADADKAEEGCLFSAKGCITAMIYIYWYSSPAWRRGCARPTA